MKLRMGEVNKKIFKPFQLDRTHFMTSFITRRSARVYEHISGIFREIGKEKNLQQCTRKQNAFFVHVLSFS